MRQAKTRTARLLSIALAAVMLLALTPGFAAPAFAAEGIIAGEPGESFEWGKPFIIGINSVNPASASDVTRIGFAGEEWYVIGYDGKGVASASGTLTLLSTDTLGSPTSFGGNSNYSGSALQIAVGGVLTSYFTDTRETDLMDSISLDGIAGGDVSAKLWPLSADQVQSVGTTIANSLKAIGTSWWLRSASNDSSADYVDSSGSSRSDGVGSTYAIRPAFQLNLASVIFTSAAEGGKSGAASAALLAAEPPGNFLKFTMENSGITLATVTAKSVSGRTITFDYTGALAGETLSAVITDSAGEVKYYGKLADSIAAATGTASVTVPDDFATGDILNIFVEEINGDNETDFCSAMVPLSFIAAAAPTGLSGIACTTSANNDGKITDTDSTMQYSADGTTWTDCADTETTGLASGSYLVRVKANGLVLASPTVTVTIFGGSDDTGVARVGFAGHEWYVIGYDGTGVASASGTVTLLSKGSLGESQFNGHFDDPGDGDYGTSELKSNVDKIFGNFAAAEPRETAQMNSINLGDIQGDAVSAQLWPLSGPEFQFSGIASTIKVLNGGTWWWLRSSYRDTNADHVDSTGYASNYQANLVQTYAVRPAFQLNLASVIFESAAEGGKSGAASAALSAASAGDFVKYTMEDTNIKLASVTATSTSGRTITFDYTGATAGKTLSAIIKDSAGELKYYGKLAENIAASGSASVTVPDDFDATDTLEIIVEEINGYLKTDFCSTPVTLSFTAAAAPTGLVGVACTTSANNDGKITDTDSTMQYSADNGANWTDCGTTITGLVPGDYLVRVKSSGLVLASPPATVTIATYYTITYNLDGGTQETGTWGGYTYAVGLTLPTAPTKTGYSFAGWYDNSGLTGSPITAIGATATGSKEFWAKWTVRNNNNNGGATYYTVTFSTDGGGSVQSQSVAYGGKATKPADPVRTDYTFSGWYKDAALTQPYDFSAAVTGNITLYAKWTQSEWNNPFIDVHKSDWFYGHVEYVCKNGLMTGTGANTFSPYLSLTRGMIVTILHRHAGEPSVAGLSNPFTDVASGQYYTDAVKWAAANKIVEGYGNGKFGPDDPVTREQLAAILYRYAVFMGKGPVGAWMIYLPFEDKDKISDYALEAVTWCYMRGIVNGKPGNLFDPKGTATRAEVAAMIHRFAEAIKQD